MTDFDQSGQPPPRPSGTCHRTRRHTRRPSAFLLVAAAWACGNGDSVAHDAKGASTRRSVAADRGTPAAAHSAPSATLSAAPHLHAPPTPATHLYVWTGDRDRRQSDFLAVLDVRPKKPTYGHIVTTLPVGDRGVMPHHTELELPVSGILFANGFMAGKTFRFDLTKAEEPRIASSFTQADGYSYPHSYVRLTKGNVLATFQGRGRENVDPGGLVEIAEDGRVVRSASAADPRARHELIRPYSLAVVPALDRVVTTSYDMGEDMGFKGGRRGRTRVVQVWRLSDLSVLKTIVLPPGPKGYEGEQPGEPRVLPDGRTVLVATFACGLYRIVGLEGANPQAEFIHAFGGGGCAVPVIVGRFWIQSDPSAHALVSLDVSDPGHPVEVSRLELGARHAPHWLALDPGGNRIVIDDRGDGELRVLLATVNRETGALEIDRDFREAGSERPGISFDRTEWPHGATGPAIPHGAVFGP
jgi:hypothetical protein